MDEYSISSSRDHCSTRHTVRGPISNEGNREHLNYLQRISAIMTSSHLKIKCLIGTAGLGYTRLILSYPIIDYRIGFFQSYLLL